MYPTAVYPTAGGNVNTRPATPTVTAITALADSGAFTGNLVPRAWSRSPLLRHASGRPNDVAIALLAEIVYWYRATEDGGRKFHADRYAVNYEQLSEALGYSDRLLRDALRFLRDAGLVRAEVRYGVRVGGFTIPCVVYVEPVAEAVAAISHEYPSESPIRRSAHAVARPTSRRSATYLPAEREHTQTTGDLSISLPNVQRSAGDIKNTEGTDPTPDQDKDQGRTSLLPLPVAVPVPVPVVSSVVTQRQKPRADMPIPAPPVPSVASPAPAPEPIPAAVAQVIAVTGDTHSRRRFEQLWRLCERERCQSCWFDALCIVEERKRAGKVHNPGALFQSLLKARVEAREVAWPDPVGYVAQETPQEVKAAVAGMLGDVLRARRGGGYGIN